MDFTYLLNIDIMIFCKYRIAGLGFCHGKKYFCQDSGKNRQKLAKTGTYKIVQKHPNLGN